jgi:hypothetical protein
MDSLRKIGKKVVLLVGDSYTNGCCPDTYQDCFASLLNESDDYEVLNFGVGGTDPLHYELVVKKYLPILKPDLVFIAVYLGNDEMAYDRTAKPNIPVCYPIKQGPWLSSEAPIHLRKANTYFKNFKEAEDFYFTYYSLWSDRSNFFEKTIRHSILLSRVYLKWKERRENKRVAAKGVLFDVPEKPPFTYNHLKEIETFCQEKNTPTLFVAIPSPADANNKINLKQKYGHLFNEITWYSKVSNLSYSDYDGRSEGNHFNNQGHLKFTQFVRPLLESKLLAIQP